MWLGDSTGEDQVRGGEEMQKRMEKGHCCEDSIDFVTDAKMEGVDIAAERSRKLFYGSPRLLARAVWETLV